MNTTIQKTLFEKLHGMPREEFLNKNSQNQTQEKPTQKTLFEKLHGMPREEFLNKNSQNQTQEKPTQKQIFAFQNMQSALYASYTAVRNTELMAKIKTIPTTKKEMSAIIGEMMSQVRMSSGNEEWDV